MTERLCVLAPTITIDLAARLRRTATDGTTVVWCASKEYAL